MTQLMSTSSEKVATYDLLHKLRRAHTPCLLSQVHTGSRRFFPMRVETLPLSPQSLLEPEEKRERHAK